MQHHNPLISEVHEKNIMETSDKLSLNEIKFRMAFSVEGFLDKEMKDDPSYVKYIIRLFSIKDGVE